MKLKKLISIACVVCFLLSLTIPAQAAELTASNQLSSYAGTTATCDVAVYDLDCGKNTNYLFDVEIPTGATKEQESQIIRQAAVSVNEKAMRASSRAVMDLISEKSGFSIQAGSNLDVGGGTLTDDYILLAVAYGGALGYNGASTLYTTITSARTPNTSYTLSRILVTSADFNVFMYTGTGSVFLEMVSTLT